MNVRVDVERYCIQPSELLDFEGTKTPGNRVLNFLGRFRKLVSFYMLPQ